MKIDGTVALVTGGASGIGKLVVRTLLEKGAKFVRILDCDEVSGSALASELQKEFGNERVEFIRCDVTSKDQLQGAFISTQSVHGRLDIVCNNAGIIDEEHLERMIQVNLVAPITGTELAKDIMMKQTDPAGGAIVNTASLAGLYPSYVISKYCATKFAVIGYSRSEADNPAVQAANIRINTICPSLVDTNLYSLYAGDETNVIQQRVNASVANSLSDVKTAFLMAVEDDTLSGRDIRVTPGMGADLHPVESQQEIREKFKMNKRK